MGLDSVAFIMRIEKEFDLEIPDEDASQLETVGQTCDYLRYRLKQGFEEPSLKRRTFYKLRGAMASGRHYATDSLCERPESGFTKNRDHP